MTLSNTGMRRIEILKLRSEQVNLQARTLSFTGKGDKRRVIPFNSEAAIVIETLMRKATAESFLFRRRTGHNLSAKQGAFHLAARRAGIEDLVFHDLRHTFSTRIRSYTDAFTVRDLMSHSDVRTTDMYVSASFDEQRRAVESLTRKDNIVRPEFHRSFTER